MKRIGPHFPVNIISHKTKLVTPFDDVSLVTLTFFCVGENVSFI